MNDIIYIYEGAKVTPINPVGNLDTVYIVKDVTLTERCLWVHVRRQDDPGIGNEFKLSELRMVNEVPQRAE